MENVGIAKNVIVIVQTIVVIVHSRIDKRDCTMRRENKVYFHLENKVKNLYSVQPDSQQGSYDLEGIKLKIYNRLLSRKFRKRAISSSYKQKINKILHYKIKHNQPLLFVYPFGGYKLWRLPSAPEVDWAEFFSISYCLDYLLPIAFIYKPGFQLEFVSDAFVVNQMNNIPSSNLKRYKSSFKSLIDYFNERLPKNSSLKFFEMATILRTNAVKKYISKNAARILEEWEFLTEEKRKKRKKMAILNMRFDNAVGNKSIHSSFNTDKIINSIIFHETYLRCPQREAYLRDNGKITLYNDPIENCIPIGSVRASRVKFWVGLGVLEKRKDRYIERILSPMQLQKISTLTKQEFDIDIVNLKNLKKISVYSQNLDFSLK